LKLVPGGPNFELSYGSTAVLPYLLGLSGKKESGDFVTLKRLANARIGEHEEKLMGPLLEFLRSKKDKGVRILGLEEGDSAKRAPTISFVIEGKSSKQVAESFDEQDVLLPPVSIDM
jgi:selenocysteine lyase/cysteine desulfurase